jgi:hypothetical protein
LPPPLPLTYAHRRIGASALVNIVIAAHRRHHAPAHLAPSASAIILVAVFTCLSAPIASITPPLASHAPHDAVVTAWPDLILA